MTKAEFVDRFAAGVRMEPDWIMELLTSLESSKGVHADMRTSDTMQVSIPLLGDKAIPIMMFSCYESGACAVYCRPILTRTLMIASGRLPAEASDFFKVLDRVVDSKAAKPVSAFFENDPKVYLDIDNLLDEREGVSKALSSLAAALV